MESWHVIEPVDIDEEMSRRAVVSSFFHSFFGKFDCRLELSHLMCYEGPHLYPASVLLALI